MSGPVYCVHFARHLADRVYAKSTFQVACKCSGAKWMTSIIDEVTCERCKESRAYKHEAYKRMCSERALRSAKRKEGKI